MRIFKKFYEYKSVLSYLNEFNDVKLAKIYYDDVLYQCEVFLGDNSDEV